MGVSPYILLLVALRHIPLTFETYELYRITKTIDSYIAQQYNPRTGTGDIVKLEDDP